MSPRRLAARRWRWYHRGVSVAALSGWLLSVMLATVPPGGSRYPKEARETAAQGKARYAAIARAVARVSLDNKEAPVFAGKHARAKTALLLLTVSLHESHWRRHIDLGLGPRSRGGGGKYHCMMQIGVPKGKTPEGWTSDDLVKSRDKCFRRALHIMQGGKKYCTKKGFGPRSFLNQYGSGRCDHGRKPVAKRWKTFDGLVAKFGFPKAPAKKQRPSKPAKHVQKKAVRQRRH